MSEVARLVGLPPEPSQGPNPDAMCVVMVGAECAPWSKTGARIGEASGAGAPTLESRAPPSALVLLLWFVAGADVRASWRRKAQQQTDPPPA
jgi:hypothetical protein